jgi:hypothetical protein
MVNNQNMQRQALKICKPQKHKIENLLIQNY